jgi:acetyl esterase/lipase
MTAVLDDAMVDELRAFNAELEQRIAGTPPLESVPAAATRAANLAGNGAFPPPVYLPEARDVIVPGRAGDIRVRVLVPQSEPIGIYVFAHGGGWVLGECDLQDPFLLEVANATGCCVASIGYRLAPEHPYPAAPDDCEDATAWLLEHGPTELGAPAVFAIGGESAGAHLALTTLLRLRDKRGITGALRAANLVYGVYDLSMTPSQRLWGNRRLPLSTTGMRWFAEQFGSGRSGEELRDPDISPLYADLRGLPPALFTIGGLDPLLDDSTFMAARWQAAGNEGELVVYPECVHGFNRFPVAAARVGNERQFAFIRERLS